jgi:hypothetical protein
MDIDGKLGDHLRQRSFSIVVFEKIEKNKTQIILLIELDIK